MCYSFRIFGKLFDLFPLCACTSLFLRTLWTFETHYCTFARSVAIPGWISTNVLGKFFDFFHFAHVLHCFSAPCGHSRHANACLPGPLPYLPGCVRPVYDHHWETLRFFSTLRMQCTVSPHFVDIRDTLMHFCQVRCHTCLDFYEHHWEMQRFFVGFRIYCIEETPPFCLDMVCLSYGGNRNKSGRPCSGELGK